MQVTAPHEVLPYFWKFLEPLPSGIKGRAPLTFWPLLYKMQISELVKRANEAVKLNPPTGADIHITSHGSDWLWAAFSVFAVFAVIHGGFFLLKGKHSIGHVAALLSSAILAFTYFTLASNLGWATTPVEFHHVTVSDPISPDQYVRQVFYARYIGWFLAWPVFLFLFEFVGHGLKLENLNTKTFATYALEVGGSEVFVLGLLISLLIHSTYKWGYFTFSSAALLFILTIINYNAFKNYTFSNLIKLTLVLFNVIWILYPVAFGLSEGGNVIQPDSEAVFYGILDLILFAIIPLIFAYQSVKDESAVPVVSPVSHAQEAKQLDPEPARASGETAV